tara:strand:+ start:265 stop:492 length:228 start_codon:yes stop_codon:yes gene_type:complete
MDASRHGRTSFIRPLFEYQGVVSMDLLRILIAILLPPLGVFLQVGIGKHFWINILLTLLGYIPGIVHAVWVIAKK